MRIQIIGLGIVGTAQAYLVRRLGHEVVGYDPKLDNHPYCKTCKCITTDSDMTFICTPESEIETVVKFLVDIKYKGLIVIKSTVPVGTTIRLSGELNVHICHNPEFLREKYSIEDVINPSRIVIGECCKTHGDILRDFYTSLERDIHTTDPTASEIAKLVSNSFRAVVITFWNEVAILCQEEDTDIRKVSEICNPSKLIGEWEGGNWGTKYFLDPYDGKCLPKDIRHLISALHVVGQNPKILEACEDFNNKLIESKNNGR